MQLWTITSADGARVLAVSYPTPSVGSHPKDNGWAWDAAAQKAWRIDAVPDLAAQRWTGAAWADDLSLVVPALLTALKAEAERRKMLTASPGGYKKTEYAAKEREVNAWESLGGTASAVLIAFNAMSSTRRQMAFPYAIADAAAFGDQPADAVARFKAGITASASAPRVAAAEAKASAAIRAATTVAAARAAAAAVAWPS